MKLFDKLWLRINKNPPRRTRAYIGTTLPWFLSGIIFSFTLLFLVGTLGGYIPPQPFVVFLVLLIVYISVSVFIDSKWGYIDAIHQHNLKRWEERKKKFRGEEVFKE